MRELNGLPTVSFYLSSASQAVSGYSTGYAFVSAIPTISFLFSLIPYALIDRSATGCFSPVGRRGLLLLSALGMAAMFLIATIVSAGFGELSVDAWSYTSTSLQAAYLALFLCALLFHNLGFRPVTDLYTAEIAASNARTETQSIAVAWGVAVGVGIAFGAAYGITGLGTYFFLVWLVLNLVWVVLIFLLYPETQGRNLEEVDGIFARGLGVLAGRNQEARRGKLIGRGVAEFQMLVGTSDSVHGSGAGIGQELRGSPGRADLENGGVAPPKYTAT